MKENVKHITADSEMFEELIMENENPSTTETEEKSDDEASDNDYTEGQTSSYRILPASDRIRCRKRNLQGIWNYFGLAEKENCEKDDCRILCLQCYENGEIKVYKRSTSSSNMWKHLSKKHNIEPHKEKVIAMTGGGDGERSNSMGFVMTTDGGTPNSADNPSVSSALDKIALQNPPINGDLGLFIIKEVAKRPLIYQFHKNKSYTKPAREELWREIHEASGKIATAAALRNIWKNIRDRYTKIRNLERRGQRMSQPYKYYTHLRFLDTDFLKDHIKKMESEDEPPLKKERLSNVDEEDNNEVECESYDFESEIEDKLFTEGEHQTDQNPLFTICSKETSLTENISMHHSYVPTDEVEHVDITEFLPTSSAPVPPATPSSHSCSCHFEGQQQPQQDEFDIFAKLISEKLRKAPKELVNEIEFEIMGIFMRKFK